MLHLTEFRTHYERMFESAFDRTGLAVLRTRSVSRAEKISDLPRGATIAENKLILDQDATTNDVFTRAVATFFADGLSRLAGDLLECGPTYRYAMPPTDDHGVTLRTSIPVRLSVVRETKIWLGETTAENAGLKIHHNGHRLTIACYVDFTTPISPAKSAEFSEF